MRQVDCICRMKMISKLLLNHINKTDLFIRQTNIRYQQLSMFMADQWTIMKLRIRELRNLINYVCVTPRGKNIYIVINHSL